MKGFVWIGESAKYHGGKLLEISNIDTDEKIISSRIDRDTPRVSLGNWAKCRVLRARQNKNIVTHALDTDSKVFLIISNCTGLGHTSIDHLHSSSCGCSIYPRQVPKNIPVDEFHGEIYDAIWTIALGLRDLHQDYDADHSRPSGSGGRVEDLDRPTSLADFTYSRKDMADKLMSKISQLRFQGASGLVSFHGADRIGTTALFQIQSVLFLLHFISFHIIDFLFLFRSIQLNQFL